MDGTERVSKYCGRRQEGERGREGRGHQCKEEERREYEQQLHFAESVSETSADSRERKRESRGRLCKREERRKR